MHRHNRPLGLALTEGLGQPMKAQTLESMATRLREACKSGASTSDVVQMLADVQAAERAKWRNACESIARDLRNHDMVRLGAAKCMDAGLRA